MAYTYLIGWKKYKKYYYGVRFSKKSDPSELWISYFTSSKYVKSFVKEYGNPDIIQIRKVFEDVNKARLWESKVLLKMKVIEKENWLNKSNNKCIDLKYSTRFGKENGMYGKKHSEETKVKMRRKFTEEHKTKLSKAKKIAYLGSGNSFYGKKHSAETKLKMSIAAKNRKKVNLG
jgi:hypothetical protein